MNENPAPMLLADGASLDEMAEASKSCTACHLYKNATQTVFGDGAKRAAVMFVGEQPGDQEDLQGEPFVGPAGRILDKGLEEAGIDRKKVYITNVVKHFKWMPKGKRRIHKKPNTEEIKACRPWLEAEIILVKPKIVVCLGATAAQALLGAAFRVTKERGRFAEWDLDPRITATVHPSSILRADEVNREAEMSAFVKDLKAVAKALASPG